MNPKVVRALLIFGGSLVIVSCVLFARVQQRLRAWEKAEARVVDVITKSYSGGKFSHFPVFEFTDSHGDVHQRQLQVGTAQPAWSVGDRTRVFFDPDNPYDLIVDTFWRKYLWSVLSGAIGAGLLLVGIVNRGKGEIEGDAG